MQTIDFSIRNRGAGSTHSYRETKRIGKAETLKNSWTINV